MGGPQSQDNVFSIATAASEYYALYNETAAAAMYVRRLIKDKQEGNDLQPTIDRMNALINKFNEEAKKHNQEAPKVSLDKASLDKVILDKSKIKK